MKWSKADLKKMGITLPGQPAKNKVITKTAPQIAEMKWALKAMNLKYVEEYKFDETRKYRADLYVPSLRLLIEYEGLQSEKSRHTTIKGYTEDCKKYFLANALGYKVLRVTVLNYKELPTYIKMLKNE